MQSDLCGNGFAGSQTKNTSSLKTLYSIVKKKAQKNKCKLKNFFWIWLACLKMFANPYKKKGQVLIKQECIFQGIALLLFQLTFTDILIQWQTMQWHTMAKVQAKDQKL